MTEVPLSVHADWQKIQKNLRHIIRHEAKPTPKQLSETAITRGFEKFAFPKAVRELLHDDRTIKKKTLVACMDLLRSPLCYVQCLGAGIAPPLVALLQDEDKECRQNAAKALEVIASKECTRDALIREAEGGSSAVRTMLAHATDPRPEQQPRAILAAQLLGKLAHMRANDEALALMIDEGDAITRLAQIIKHGTAHTLQLAATHLLTILCRRDDAKVQAVKAGCVPSLIDLLTRGHLDLAIEASGALSMIVIAVDGKVALYERGEALIFAELLDWLDERLQLNLLSCISNAAEHPLMRTLFKDAGILEALNRVSTSAESDLVRVASAQAHRQCVFEHRPFKLLAGATPLTEAELLEKNKTLADE